MKPERIDFVKTIFTRISAVISALLLTFAGCESWPVNSTTAIPESSYVDPVNMVSYEVNGDPDGPGDTLSYTRSGDTIEVNVKSLKFYDILLIRL